MSGHVVIWTIGGRRTASTRLRVHAYLSRLEEDGIETAVSEIPRGFLPRWRQRRSLPRNGVLLIQKKLLSHWELDRVRRQAGRVLYDVDDAVYLDGERSTRNRDRFQKITGIADTVLAGNQTLARAAARPERVTVLPTPVDVDKIQPSSWNSRVPGLAVWIGSRTNLFNLDTVFPALAAVRTKGMDVRLLVVADRPPHVLPDGVEFEPWSFEAEQQALERATLGVMPLEDTEFNRGKCGFKILLYQAAGLPVIASPVGVNAEILHHGETGILASSAEDWEGGLRAIAGDPRFAEGLGDAGRTSVVSTHAIDVLYPGFRDAILEGAAR